MDAKLIEEQSSAQPAAPARSQSVDCATATSAPAIRGIRPTASLAELAEKLDGVTGRLADYIVATAGPEPHEDVEQWLQEMRDVCSSLHGAALLLDSVLSENTPEHREAFKALVCAFGEKIRTASHTSQDIVEGVAKQMEELDSLSDMEPGEELAAGLQAALANVSQAAGEVGSHIATVAADVDLASQEITSLENVLVDAGKKAHRDELTGTHSRLALDLAVYQAIGDEGDGSPCSFMVIDLDDFRGVNDRLGRVVANALLCKVARMIEQALPGAEREWILGRYGGEEFGVLIHGATILEARDVAGQVRQKIASSKWTIRGCAEGVLQATVSIGVTQHGAGDTVNAIMERCQAALRKAKRDGRNRVAIEYPSTTGAAATQRAAMRGRL